MWCPAQGRKTPVPVRGGPVRLLRRATSYCALEIKVNDSNPAGRGAMMGEARKPYAWDCAWCKSSYVWLDRREPSHLRGEGDHLFCSTYCLKAWQAERVPPVLRRSAG